MKRFAAHYKISVKDTEKKPQNQEKKCPFSSPKRPLTPFDKPRIIHSLKRDILIERRGISKRIHPLPLKTSCRK
jgi:hypothetical protein